MTEWCTIESDPGVFTELIRNVGVKGVQVEEVLDLDMLSSFDQTVYGIVFLFKYIKNSGYEPMVMTHYDEELYFPKQVIINACATQAILAILLNNEDKLELGNELQEFKNFTRLMDPYMKGLSISNSEKIRLEHNKFGKPEPFIFSGKRKATDDDVFHYVSYIYFKNNIYEIDGMREGPILIAENVNVNEWVDVLKPSIMKRISLYENNEIKFNLLAMVPDKRLKAKEIENELTYRRNFISNLLNGVKDNSHELFHEYGNLSNDELIKVIADIDFQLENQKIIIEEENQKFEKYKIENERRQHNYIPLIFELLKIMSEKNALQEVYDQAKLDEQNKIKK